MYYYLIGALKRRLILELQDSFKDHPVYEKIVPFIQNRYAFDERPQYGIVVKGSSANKVQLAADNFKGTVESYVMLAYINNPAFPIEWVQEDLKCVRANHDRMPTPPGVYFLEILKAPENANEAGEYMIDPLLTVTDEAVLQFVTGIERLAQLQNVPMKGTLRLWENRNYLLKEGQDYTADYVTGEITFITRMNPGAIVTAGYRFPAPSIGPKPFWWNQADTKTLHGIVLAFGKRARKGDKVAIVVYPDRVDTARAYGGKFEVTFEFDVISQDTTQMEEIADLAIMYLYAIKKPVLEIEGIELVDISMGGEAEETYDEQADLYYYTASLSLQLRAEWELHLPLPLTISKVSAVSAGAQASITPDRQTTQTSSIVGVGANKIFFATYPLIAGRNDAFERIV